MSFPALGAMEGGEGKLGARLAQKENREPISQAPADISLQYQYQHHNQVTVNCTS